MLVPENVCPWPVNDDKYTRECITTSPEISKPYAFIVMRSKFGISLLWSPQWQTDLYRLQLDERSGMISKLMGIEVAQH